MFHASWLCTKLCHVMPVTENNNIIGGVSRLFYHLIKPSYFINFGANQPDLDYLDKPHDRDCRQRLEKL